MNEVLNFVNEKTKELFMYKEVRYEQEVPGIYA